MLDLRDDPSVASEALDHPEGWPQDRDVREWMRRAMTFLGENAPEGRFAFQAGWLDHQREFQAEVSLETFLDVIATGGLRADQEYRVRAIG